MREKDVYQDFVDRTFREIDDLESESKQTPILTELREYGLTLAEAARRYYKRGMTGREFLEAIRTDHENK